MRWEAADAENVRVVGSGDTADVRGLAPCETTVTATYTYMGQTARDTTRVLAYRVVIANPTGDPVNAGSDTNEFTYSSARPGVLTIPCRARVAPDDAEARAEAESRSTWTIDAVGDSAVAWSSADPADASQGRGLETTATFTGLPARHDDFGPKNVTLTVCGGQVSTPIEVFWSKNATNHPPDGLTHPGGTAPTGSSTGGRSSARGTCGMSATAGPGPRASMAGCPP